MFRLFQCCLLMALSALCHAQTPKFDVASVKVSRTGTVFSTSNYRNGRYIAENQTLRSLIATAYELPATLVNGQGWIDADRFDIQAHCSADTQSQLPAMLQALLVERFHLVVHRET